MIRSIVWFAILVVVTGLAPVVISRFAVAGHGLWVACTVLYLVLWWGGSGLLDRMNPERSRLFRGFSGTDRIRMEIPAAPLWLTSNLAVIFILLGVFPDTNRRPISPRWRSPFS